MRNRRLRPLAILLGCLATVGACSAADEVDLRSSDGTILETLARMPDRPHYRTEVAIDDHELVRRRLGVADYGGTTEEAYRDWLVSWVLSAELAVTAPLVAPGAQADYSTEFGFAVSAVQQVGRFGSAPEDGTTFVLDDTSGIEAAVLADPVWSEDLDVRMVDGGVVYAWGSEAEVLVDRISDARPLGRGGQLAVADDGTIVRSVVTSVSIDALAVAAGDEPSLGERREYADAARVLQDAGAHTAHFYPPRLADVSIFGIVDPTEAVEKLESLPTVASYDLLALGGVLVPGLGDDGGAGVTAVAALVHATTDEAEANRSRLQNVLDTGESAFLNAGWSDVLGDARLRVDGTVLVLESGASDSYGVVRTAALGDTLFAYGER